MPDKKTEVEIAYFAGFFDGEGSIAIYEASSSYIVVLANTDIRPLKRAKEIWGGNLNCQLKAGVRGAIQDIWRWQLNGHNAQPFLEDIRPYLMLKREQADVFLETLQHMPNGNGQRRKEGATEAIQAADLHLRLLKRGAVNG